MEQETKKKESTPDSQKETLAIIEANRLAMEQHLKKQCLELALMTIKVEKEQDKGIGQIHHRLMSTRGLTTDEAIKDAEKIYNFITNNETK